MRSKRNRLGGLAAPLCVTGIGLASAAGRGTQALSRALEERTSFLAPAKGIRRGGSPGAMGGRLDESIVRSWRFLEPGDDRAVALAALAMEEALERAALPPGRLGLSVGTALGPIGKLEEAVEAGAAGAAGAVAGGGVVDSPRVPVPYSFEAYAGRLARTCAVLSPRSALLEPTCFSVTCVSGLCAIEQAAADLAFRRADAVLTGGVDALTRFMHAGFGSLGALSPSGCLRPFDVEHDGIVIGEAAAFAVLEPPQAASHREARVLGCVVSQRLVSDAMHLTSPDPEGRGMARAIGGALSDACIAPEEIGCITVTAAGSEVYDRMESRAVLTKLGPRAAARVPVTTWEPAVGHVLAATGALGVVHAAMVLSEGLVRPVFGVERVDPDCQLRYVLGGPVPLDSPCVLALTVGFGGQNGATVVTSLEMAMDLLGRSGEPVR